MYCTCNTAQRWLTPAVGCLSLVVTAASVVIQDEVVFVTDKHWLEGETIRMVASLTAKTMATTTKTIRAMTTAMKVVLLTALRSAVSSPVVAPAAAAAAPAAYLHTAQYTYTLLPYVSA